MNIKLGSLFDGIGGFPYVGTLLGIEPIWASEIEPFPIRVTEQHFPNMKHLGDITQINGGEIEPVDIITFGSPCQDLSVAGKREGLAGARSGLFMEAVRIIREMRTATSGQYPRFAVWENVPGAYSSNSGQDFRAVLEEIAETEIPMPASGKWAEAGMVRTESVDIAWRTLDAQYWGVPQRRKRIFLVADFGGQCAGEILFVDLRLPWNSKTSREAGEEAAGDAGDGVAESNCLTPWDCQSKRIFKDDGKWPTLYSHQGGGGAHGYVAVGFEQEQSADARGIGWQEEIAPTLPSEGATPCICLADQGGQQMAVYDDITSTLRAQEHGHQPCVISCATKQISQNIGFDVAMPVMANDYKEPQVVCIQNATRGKSQNGLGISQDDVSYTLDSLGNHAVAYPDPANTLLGKANLSFRDDVDTVVTVDCRNFCENEELSGTLQHKESGGHSLNYQNPVRVGYAVRRLTPLECERLQGFPDGWTDVEWIEYPKYVGKNSKRKNIPMNVRKKRAVDTQRYKAIGNSVAIPCVMFVLSGIARVLKRDRAV